jgi:hypothetical protein
MRSDQRKVLGLARGCTYHRVALVGQSERRRRLALAGGFRLLRSFEIDRLDELAHGAGRGSIGPDGWGS